MAMAKKSSTRLKNTTTTKQRCWYSSWLTLVVRSLVEKRWERAPRVRESPFGIPVAYFTIQARVLVPSLHTYQCLLILMLVGSGTNGKWIDHSRCFSLYLNVNVNTIRITRFIYPFRASSCLPWSFFHREKETKKFRLVFKLSVKTFPPCVCYLVS